MRHMGRTFAVNLSFICDCIMNRQVRHGYINIDVMKADIFTKFFSDKKLPVWQRVRQNVNVYECEWIPKPQR